MPMPVDIDPALLREWTEEAINFDYSSPSIPEMLRNATPEIKEKLKAIHIASCWVLFKLGELSENNEDFAKAFKKSRQKIMMGFGQRCFAAMDEWEVAKEVVNRFRQNIWDNDLEMLGHQLSRQGPKPTSSRIKVSAEKMQLYKKLVKRQA